MYAHHATHHSVLLLDFILNSTQCHTIPIYLHSIQHTHPPTLPPPIFLLCTLHYLTTKQQRERFATQHNNILRNFIRNVIQEGLSSLFFFRLFCCFCFLVRLNVSMYEQYRQKVHQVFMCIFEVFFLACVMQLR